MLQSWLCIPYSGFRIENINYHFDHFLLCNTRDNLIFLFLDRQHIKFHHMYIFSDVLNIEEISILLYISIKFIEFFFISIFIFIFIFILIFIIFVNRLPLFFFFAREWSELIINELSFNFMQCNALCRLYNIIV